MKPATATKLLSVLVMLGSVAAVLTGCTQNATSSAECTSDQAREAGEPGDAEPLLVLGSLKQVPIVLYGDGAVAVPLSQTRGDEATAFLTGGLTGAAVRAIPGYMGPQPNQYIAGWLNPCELEQAITAAELLIDPDVDYGDPPVTDQAYTLISYHPEGGAAEEIRVYAFNPYEPDAWGGLTSEQTQQRKALAALWTDIETGSTLTDPIPIDRVYIFAHRSLSDAEVTWPLPPFSQVVTDGCATLSGSQMQTLLDFIESDSGPIVDDGNAPGFGPMDIVAAAPGMPECAEM